MLIGVLSSLLHLVADVLLFWQRKIGAKLRPVAQIRASLANAADFAQYEDIAERLDFELGHDIWRRNPQSRKYDHRLIAHRLSGLRLARLANDGSTVVELLRSGLLRNLGNIGDKQLYNRSYLGTKFLIQDYITEVMLCLEYIRSLPESSPPFFTADRKLQFFKDVRHSYGLSALILQGGASFGLFHLGIVRALWEQALLPSIISGTAIGALIAALVCITPDENLPQLMYEDGINLDAFDKRGSRGQTLRKVKRFFNEGYLLDISVLGELCRDNIGDLTFEEAFLKTNRVLNITILSTSVNSVPSLLNYLTAPNVLIWTAALASNALPGLYEPVELLCKDEEGHIVPWAPYGGIRFTRSAEEMTPFDRLSELFNVNNFIVSQARPYLAPFLSSPLHRHRRRGWYLKMIKVIGLEISHRAKQLSLLGFLPSYTRSYVQGILPLQSEVTLVPSLAILDFFKVFRHPTHREIQYWTGRGERAIWPAMALLRVRGLIEVTLSECYEATRHEEQTHLPGSSVSRQPITSRGRNDAALPVASQSKIDNRAAQKPRKRSRTVDLDFATTKIVT